MKPPRLCGCGRRIAGGARCACQRKRDAERKARHDATRPSSSARGYTSTWEAARARFLAEHGTCAHPGCTADAAVVDHIRPHRGDLSLFWNRANWQPLCAHHHNSHKQRQERAVQ